MWISVSWIVLVTSQKNEYTQNNLRFIVYNEFMVTSEAIHQRFYEWLGILAFDPDKIRHKLKIAYITRCHDG